MKAKKKKVNRQDATLINVRAANKKMVLIWEELKLCGQHLLRQMEFNHTLLDILKSKRLLTPAQVKMLEECLR